MYEMNVKRTSTAACCVLCVVMVCVFLFSGCGKEEKKESVQLNVKIVNVDGMVDETGFSSFVEQFKKSHQDLIVNCASDIVSSDISSDDLSQLIAQSDVVIFPSIVNERIRPQADAFYPLKNINLTVPPVLDAAYAGSLESSYWSVPLLIDPMMMFIKKNNIDDFMPDDWQTLYMRADMMDRDQPYFVFLTENLWGLADAIATQQLSFGYESKALRNRSPEEGVTEKDLIGIYTRSLVNMKRFMIDAPEDRLTEIPQVKNLKSFLDSDAYATFGRYSEFARLSDADKERLFVRDIPNTFGPISPCIAISAGIPIQSANPAGGEEFVQYLIGRMFDLSNESNMLASSLSSFNELGKNVYKKKDVIFVPRQNNSAISDRIVLDVLNGDVGIVDLNQLWRPSFFIPSSNL